MGRGDREDAKFSTWAFILFDSTCTCYAEVPPLVPMQGPGWLY